MKPEELLDAMKNISPDYIAEAKPVEAKPAAPKPAEAKPAAAKPEPAKGK